MKEKLQELCEREGYEVKRIGLKQTMSGDLHANAVTNYKTIKISMTLLEHHADQPNETLAILAHELGHRHHDHTLYRTVINLGYMFIFGCLYTHVIGNEQFLLAYDIKMESLILTFFYYALQIYFTLDVISRLFIKWMERRTEYEADAFSLQ